MLRIPVGTHGEWGRGENSTRRGEWGWGQKKDVGTGTGKALPAPAPRGCHP